MSFELNFNWAQILPKIVFSVLFGGMALIAWWEYEAPVTIKSKRQDSPLCITGANNFNMGESQNLLPSTIQSSQGLFISGELNEFSALFANSSSRSRDGYKYIVTRYPLSGRLGLVFEAMDEMRRLQDESERLLSKQIQLTENEIFKRTQAEQSFLAESKIRAEAEDITELCQAKIRQFSREKIKVLEKKDEIIEIVNKIKLITDKHSENPANTDLNNIISSLLQISQELQ